MINIWDWVVKTQWECIIVAYAVNWCTWSPTISTKGRLHYQYTVN